MAEEFDLVIIGTGSGNSILDERFEDWRVAIVERDAFGGTCLNRGCIPTKMLVRPADVILAAQRAGRLGVDASIDRVRWRDIRDRVFGRIDPIAADGARYRRDQPHVTVFAGEGRFVAPKELVVRRSDGTEQRITGSRFVLAAGARPIIPEVIATSGVEVHTSDTIMRIGEVPSRLVIIGGGFIAAELAHVFGSFGAEVTIVTRGPTLLNGHDEEISRRFTEAQRQRFNVHLGARVEGLVRNRDQILVAIRDAADQLLRLDADAVLVAVGRQPNSDQLDVAATGVRTDERGFVHTDATLETTVPGIFALGDIRTPVMLKHVANHEARVVAENLLEPRTPQRIDERFVPHAVFGSPEVAAVGLTEAEARAQGRSVLIGQVDYGATAYGWALEDTTSCCKVIVDGDGGELLGAHVVGPHASLVIQPAVTAMQFGITASQLARTPLYPHPALSEVLEQALLDATGATGH